ncbi:MAG: LysM peptidoglycan-binding domain-containing protein [Anaerolineales bacterium]|nr:LysM peptidoglycan-binding domain-containing protein [Anaerolineales bacterium]
MTVKAGGRAAPKPKTLAGAADRSGGRPPIALMVALSLLIVVGITAAYLIYSGIVQIPNPFAGPDDVPTATLQVAVANTPTVTLTAPPTFTPPPSPTETTAPTPTPLPPTEYSVVSGDTCAALAAEYNVSSASIIQLNNLDPNCNLSVGIVLLIPQPTGTPTPLPTATLGAIVATQPPRLTYTVHAGDTLQGIANFYGVTVADLMEVNGIADPESIRPDQVLIIPVERIITPGPSPTPTPLPPWPAPNQLLPTDGQAFGAGDIVTLQWTSIGALRPDEFYYVVIEDVTCNCARFYRAPTTDTKLIVPVTFRHTDNAIHVYRWTVTTVRQRPNTSVQPEFDPAGATSTIHDFVWAGGAP